MSEEFICRQGGQISPLELNKKGKLSVEIALGLPFLIPGLIYSIWRRTARWFAFPDCGTHHMVPLKSPMDRDAHGKKLQSAAKLASTKV